MEHDLEHEVHSVDDFWTELENVLARECHQHDHIDDALRSYLALLEAHHQEYITTDDHLGHCAYLLYVSPLFASHASYVRQQLIYCLLQEDEPNILRITVTFLLADARETETTFDLLNKEGVFPRLVKLIANPQEHEETTHRSLMELLYELARIQKITNNDLACVNDDFIVSLFDLIEQVSDDVNDPYHYPVIRVLLVLNEQFMVAAHDPDVLSKNVMPLTNKVVKVLSSHGHRYKTFGANIILLLNRENETSLQLLTLKLMYLLFTTPPTYEYFYTNDLHVLVDILIRNLLDLPGYAASLRHTYLRVFFPLLEHTQLQHPPYYKRFEIRKLLAVLCGEKAENEDGTIAEQTWNHFEAVDETTKRLVTRCKSVSWLANPESLKPVRSESPIDETSPDPESPSSPSKPKPPQLPAPRKLRKRDSSKASTLTIGQFLTPQLESARHSSVSMVEMAQQKEKPGVITPSRNPSLKQGIRQTVFAKREKPPPPQARRSGFRRPKASTAATELEITREGVPEHRHIPDEQRNEAETYEETMKSGKSAATGPEGEQPHKVDKVADDSELKKPPPAPKARRGWRMRKSKDMSHEGKAHDTSSTQDQSAINITPLHTSRRDPGAILESPFSPTQDKTLDPLEDTTTATRGDQKRSVHDALSQAQAQATQQLEECLESTHIGELSAPTGSVDVVAKHRESPSMAPSSSFRRTVLAPPSPAPTRGVPGPRVELEKSPFLNEDELAMDNDGTPPEEMPKRVLRAKDSWEDFDNDE